MNRILAAMSGGVDSAAAAALLIGRGQTVEGATLRLFDSEHAEREIIEAARVCETLGIPHHVIDLRATFSQNVIDPFINGYLGGITPNPCVDCNRTVKFGALFAAALEMGFGSLATGHYACVECSGGSGRYLLKKPLDLTKDQTYVLYSLTQEHLSRVVFPLSGITKTEARKTAADLGLDVAGKPDSQDICFVKDGDYAGFIRNMGVSPKEGDFIDTNGNVLGRHKGLIHYTVGQTKRLGTSFGEKRYVAEKDAAANTVTVAGEDALYTDSCTVGNVNLISMDCAADFPAEVTVKTRYSQKEQPAVIRRIGGGRILVEFLAPQRAITPGQAAVFYDGDVVLGGGTIL